MFRRCTLGLACVLFLLPVSAFGQGKDDFARAVVDAINADQEPPARRRAAMAAAVDAMAAALKAWDAAVGKVEAGFAANVDAAPPDVVAKMRLALGAVHLERGNLKAAAAQLQLSVSGDAENPDGFTFYGLALDRLGRSAEALDAYRMAWWRGRRNAPAETYRLLRAARHVSAPLAPGLATDIPNARDALVAMVEAPGQAGPLSLATVSLLDDSLSPAPMMPSLQFADAFSMLRAGRYEDAITSFRKALVASIATDRRLTPADVRVADATGPAPILGASPLFARLGREAHARLDLDAAVAAYERRIDVDPNNAAAHLDLAEVFRARDDLDDAIIEAAAAALLDPNAARPVLVIGQLHAAAGRMDAAARVLQRAVTMAPADPEARYALSRALLSLGRRAEADRELEVFRQLQAQAMAEERQRFDDNFRKIQETLQQPPGAAR